MFPDFTLIETVAGAILTVLLGYKYIKHRRVHHLVWMIALIFWSAFELTVLLRFVFGLDTAIMNKISSILGMPIAALFGVGMLFLLQGLFRRPWARYFLIYVLIVYVLLIGTVLAGIIKAYPTPAVVWILLMIPGGFVLMFGSIYSYHLGKKRNLLMAIGFFGSIIGGIFWETGVLLFDALDTVGEIIVGLGLYIAMEPPFQRSRIRCLNFLP
jgi:hypothetical protein